MALFRESIEGGQEEGHLQQALEKANLRLEEVANYYRGELEAARRRAEEEAVRIQAAEAGRRRRAEEQVAQLRAQLKSAKTDADHAQRRYQELLSRIGEIEQEGRHEARAEFDQYEQAAKAAWKTAEEEVERLDEELAAMRGKLETARAESRELASAREQLEADHAHLERNRNRMIVRLKRALKMSEQRRQALEVQVDSLSEDTVHRRRSLHGAGNPREVSGLERIRVGGGNETLQVDPAAGWGSTSVHGADDFSDEFLLAGADESFSEQPREAEPREPAAPEEITDQEAEALMMRLNVDRKVAQRQARATTEQPAAQGPVVPPPPRHRSFVERWRWVLLGSGVAVFAAVAVVLAFGPARGVTSFRSRSARSLPCPRRTQGR